MTLDRHARQAADCQRTLQPAGGLDAPRGDLLDPGHPILGIDDVIAGLADKIHRLDGLIASYDGPTPQLIAMLNLYTQATGRLARLLRDRQALSGEGSDELAAAVREALDELAAEWDADL